LLLLFQALLAVALPVPLAVVLAAVGCLVVAIAVLRLSVAVVAADLTDFLCERD
jgi:hypothetical protein